MQQFDCIIVGGGIAGLWTLARLRAAGYHAILIEKTAIGGIQSIASQGIIHGGSKYALGGRLGDSAKAIGDMPAIWQACLEGRGEIDLSAVRVLTQSQLMWSTPGAVSRVAGFFAGRLMQDRMQQLDRKHFPAPFDSDSFNGVVYRLNEPVLDTASLMQVLYQQLRPYCFAGNVSFAGHDPHGIVCAGNTARVELSAKKLVLTSGLGNASVLSLLGRERPQMQKRPVHMVMLKGNLPELYAHCLGASSNPRVTITSGSINNDTVWYVGGGIAESGIGRSSGEQIDACKQELADVLPWLDWRDVQWSTVMLDRTEIKTPGNKRPESSFVQQDDDVITVWPTKLAFAPRVAGQILQILQHDIAPGTSPASMPDIGLMHPEAALQPWLEASWS